MKELLTGQDNLGFRKLNIEITVSPYALNFITKLVVAFETACRTSSSLQGENTKVRDCFLSAINQEQWETYLLVNALAVAHFDGRTFLIPDHIKHVFRGVVYHQVQLRFPLYGDLDGTYSNLLHDMITITLEHTCPF